MDSLLYKILPSFPVLAHCDVPCGIYSVEPAKIAAATCLKMVQKIEDLPADGTDEEMIEAHNSFVRMIITKEEHARVCKHELMTLWTDYFKPEHLSLFPNLSDTFWQAAKLCSQVKQTVSEEKAKQLVEAVNEIAEIFAKAESTKTH